MGSVAGSVAGHTLRVGSMRQRQKICDRRRRICPFSVLDAEAFFFWLLRPSAENGNCFSDPTLRVVLARATWCQQLCDIAFLP